MAGFDRSKLKTTSDSVIKEQSQTFAKGERTYLSIETGDNKFRIFPYHPDGGGKSFAVAKSVSFLEVKRPKWDKETKKVIEGQFEIKQFPIFNSKVHAGWPFDLVEEYMNFANKRAISDFVGDDKEAFDTIWEKIVGNAKKKINGIKPQNSWVVYASQSSGKDENGRDIWGPVGLLDGIKPTVKDLMNERAAELETPDPYSHHEEGIAVIIHKAKNAEKPADWYKVRLDRNISNGKDLGTKATPLTDAQLEEWSKLKPLHELFVNSFKKSDLEMQVEGLQRFDKKLTEQGYAINVFGYDEFLDIVEKAYALADTLKEDDKKEEEGVDDEQEEATQKQEETPTKKINKKKIEEDDGMDDLDRTFAKVPGKVLADQKRAEAANKIVKKQPTPIQEEEEVVTQITSTSSSVMDRLAQIRNKAPKK